MKSLLTLSRLIDALNERVGRFTTWLVLACVLISAANAIARAARKQIISVLPPVAPDGIPTS